MARLKSSISLIDKLFAIPETRGLKYKVIVFFRVLLVSLKDFLKDDCLMMASGIAYTIVVSLVPTLTVGLALITLTSGFDSKKEELFETITSFLIKNNIPIDITPYLKTLNDIVNSATQIGAIGFIVLIFSATAILRTFESAFNRIWRISAERSFFSKIIFYSFLMFIGPLLAIVVIGYVNKVSDFLRSPHLSSVVKTSTDKIWIAGEKGSLFPIDSKGIKLNKNTTLKIDFENVKCLNSSGVLQKVCEPPSIHSQNFVQLHSLQNRLYALSSSGVFLFSEDEGKTWNLHYFINTNFKDLAILDKDNFYLIYDNGNILVYSLTEPAYKLVLKNVEKLNANKVKFFGPKIGFIVCSDGTIWKTNDRGNSFKGISVSEHEINDIEYIGGDDYIVVGDRGKVLVSTDDGETWVHDISYKNFSYNRVWVIENGDIDIYMLSSEIGDLFCSYNWGEKWHNCYNDKSAKINSIISVSSNSDQDKSKKTKKKFSLNLFQNKNSTPISSNSNLIGVGEFSRFAFGSVNINNIFWTTLKGGESILSFYYILRIIFPLLAIWAFFVLLYMLIPNTRVSLRAASYGAAVTGLIFLFFIIFFIIYMSSFSQSTVIIYQALAAIPIFLLYVYCLCIIILYGAEVTATLHYRERYLLPGNILEETNDEKKHYFFIAVKSMQQLYSYQRQYKKVPTKKELLNQFNVLPSELERTIQFLIQYEFIAITLEDKIIPIIPADEITFYDFYSKYFKESFLISPEEMDLSIKTKIELLLLEIDTTIKNQLTTVKFSDLI